MARSEFSRRTRREALKRAYGRCEGILASGCRCTAPLTLGKYHFDHVVADQLGGKPDLSNCSVLCVPCHTDKTARDARLITKAKRRADAHAGIKTAPRRTISSAPFPKPAPRNGATGPLTKACPGPRAIERRVEMETSR